MKTLLITLFTLFCSVLPSDWQVENEKAVYRNGNIQVDVIIVDNAMFFAIQNAENGKDTTGVINFSKLK
jgi:hypothetical protein